jgi:acetyl-CoA acetyltransferase
LETPGQFPEERLFVESDRAAVDVQAVQVDAQVAVRRDGLRGERLVDLDQVDFADRQARAGQRLLGRLDRAAAHDLGEMPVTSVDTICASGVRPSSRALVSDAPWCRK